MSKLYDIKKIYAQDFGIAVTNAPSIAVKKSSNLLKNVLLIASPEAGWQEGKGQGEDEGTPALFATDYEGNPVQLTYPIRTNKNGLDIDDDGYLTLKIDGKTIKSQENLDDGDILEGLPIFVDTTNLTFARLNDSSNRGVVNVNDYIQISRDANDFNVDQGQVKAYSGISITNDGCLYISELFLNKLIAYIQNSIENKVKPLAKENMSASVSIDDENLILYTGVNPYQTEAIGTKSENGYYNIKKMTLNFISESDKPIEDISLPVVSGNMLIKINGQDKGTSEVDTEKPYLVLGDYKQYNHTLRNIEAVIYPNYNIINNQFIQTTNAFKIDGIKELDKTIREYPSVSFTQAAMENSSDTGFLFKITNNVSMDLNYTMESNVISVSMGSSVNINYRGLYSYTNQDKRYEPISYKYKIFIGPQEIYEETIEPNKDTNIKSISVGYSDINDQNSSALDIIKNSSVRDNTGQIQILGSAATYNKLYAILYIYLPGQEPFQYESNKINVNHKNVGNYKNVVFKFAPTYCSGQSVSTSLETHALSLNSGNNGLVSYILQTISTNNSVRLKLTFNYRSDEYVLKGISNVSSLLFTPQDGTTPINFQNTNADNTQLSGTGTSITLGEGDFNVMTNYIVRTTFSEDNPNFSTDSDFTLNLYEVILNRLKNIIQFETSSGGNVQEGAEIKQEYIYINKKISFEGVGLDISIGENSTSLNAENENGKYKIKINPEPVNIELIVKKDTVSSPFTFTVTKEMPIYKLGTISSINLDATPTLVSGNVYRIKYSLTFSGTDSGGHIPNYIGFSPNNVATATLDNVHQTDYKSGYIDITVTSNESCTMTFEVRGTNSVSKSIEYNFGSTQEQTNSLVLQSFTININGRSMSSTNIETANINKNSTGILEIVPYPDTAEALFNIDYSSKHIRITQDTESDNDNRYIINPIDESGTEDYDTITISPLGSNIDSQSVKITVSEDQSTSGTTLSSISWLGNSGDTQTITNDNNQHQVGTLLISPNNANGFGIQTTFTKDGISLSGITSRYDTTNNNLYITPALPESGSNDAFNGNHSINVIMTVTPTGNTTASSITKTLIINKNELNTNVLTSFDFTNDTNPIDIEQLSSTLLQLELNPNYSTVQFNWTTDSNDIQLTPSSDTHSCTIKGNNITSSTATITVTPIGDFGLSSITKQINVTVQENGEVKIRLSCPTRVITSNGLSIARNETLTINAQKINCTGSITWEASPECNNQSAVTISNTTDNSCSITGNSITISYDYTLRASLVYNGETILAEIPIKVNLNDESNDPNEDTVETGQPSYARYFKSTDSLGTSYQEIYYSEINSGFSLGVTKGDSVKLKAKVYTANNEYITSASVSWSLTDGNDNYTLLNANSNPCTIRAANNDTVLLTGTIECNYGGLLPDVIKLSSRTLIPIDDPIG